MSISSLILHRRARRGAVSLALTASLTLGTLVSLSTASGAATTTSATPNAATPHCIARVVGRAASGELQLSASTCYATYAQVLQSVGKPVADKKITPTDALAQGLIGLRSTVGGALAAFGGGGSGIIGVHFDGYNFTGSSFSVSGTDCYGGYINLSGYWANRVSSTINGCPVVTHYYWQNLGGTYESTYGGGNNLSYMDNLSESIAYQGW